MEGRWKGHARERSYLIIYNKVYDVFVIDKNQERRKRCVKTENFF